MTTTYVPRPGSRAEAAVAALQREGWLSAEDLAAGMDVELTNLHGNISVALREGLIRRVERDGVSGFELGSGTAESAPRAAKRVKTRRERPPQPGNAIPRADHAIDQPGSIAIIDDGSVLLLDGDRIIARLSARQAANIAAFITRHRPIEHG